MPGVFNHVKTSTHSRDITDRGRTDRLNRFASLSRDACRGERRPLG
jgi:hypothetical protein